MTYIETIKVQLANDEENKVWTLNAVYNRNKQIIKYKEEDDTTVTLNLEKMKLVRENESLKLEYVFKKGQKTVGEIYIKAIKQQVDVNIETKDIIFKENYFEVRYMLEDQEILYKVEVM